jgi:hypothetical protein
MDRFALEDNLSAACARVLACQQALLSQRIQVRELERCGLDVSVARALLDIYEESKAMAVFNRDCVAKALAMAKVTTSAAADPSFDNAEHDETFVEDDFPYRAAA